MRRAIDRIDSWSDGSDFSNTTNPGDFTQDMERLDHTLLIYHRTGVVAVPIQEHTDLTIGRSTNADLTVDDKILSRRHLRVFRRGEHIYAEDLGSKNGCKLDGLPFTRTRLGAGNSLEFGRCRAVLYSSSDGELSPFGLPTHDRFCEHLSDEIARAIEFERPVAIVMFTTRGGDQHGVHHWYPKLQPLLRSVDKVAQYAPGTIEILLPETSATDAHLLAERLVKEIGDEEASVLCGLATLPESGMTAHELLDGCRMALWTATADAPILHAQSLAGAPGPTTGQSAQSELMRQLGARVSRVADAMIPVLITGETGVGKEVLARELHRRSPRRGGPFQAVNCGAIPPDLLESTLFGHVQGAFTGADSSHAGVFESADGGIVFLDEVAELSHAAQAALLRILETRCVTRVGSTVEIPVDVRFIAASHRSIEDMCQAGTFRWDLYYRLNGISMKVPPVRERREEIPALAETFLTEANEENNREVRGITTEALDLLVHYDWPGNIRELRNAIFRAVVITEDEQIAPRDLPERVLAHPNRIAAQARKAAEEDADRPTLELQSVGPVDAIDVMGTLTFKERMRVCEGVLISQALQQTGNNKTEAAKLLCIPIRTLTDKISRFGLEEEEPNRSRDDLALLSMRFAGMADLALPLTFKARMQRYEESLIKKALQREQGNKTRAAGALRMNYRTFTNKLETFKLG